MNLQTYKELVKESVEINTSVKHLSISYDKIEKKLANYEDSPKKEKIKSIIYQEGIELILIASKEIIGWINVNVLKNYRGNCCYSAILNNLNLNTFYAINECTSKILRILQEN